MEEKIRQFVEEAIRSAKKAGEIGSTPPEIVLEIPKQESFGDFATNVALQIASIEKKPPRQVAQIVIGHLSIPKELVEKVEVAGPGFINFYLNPKAFFGALGEILLRGDQYGSVNLGQGQKVLVEFVSANPTGPLHIGHGRGAVVGDCLARILACAGFRVNKEYYVNDAGVQMRTLGRSVYLRARELKGGKSPYPADCYQGDYILALARECLTTAKMKSYLNLREEEAHEKLGGWAGEKILEEIKKDLADLGVELESYFFETELYKKKAIERSLDFLKKKDWIYEQEGATWFRSTKAADDKDRVLKKSDGTYTYFATDIAYHGNKFSRGYDSLVDIWGADHLGYAPRMKAAIQALGKGADSLQVVFIQMVNLIRGGQVVAMSTRQAQYETLRSVLDEVGKDVARYFFLMRAHSTPLDFDLELAKKETPENPVYYIQYAHARISSIFRKAKEQGAIVSQENVDFSLLDLLQEAGLAKKILLYPKQVVQAARELAPHLIAFYLLDLAKDFQAYYSLAKNDARYRVITSDSKRTQAKLYLVRALQIVLKNGLNLLGISAPEHMEREEA